MLKPMSKLTVQNQFRFRLSLGVSSLRFLPKQKSLRPIINMGTTDIQLTNKKLSVNQQLLNVHQILNYLRVRCPALVGYGKLGTSELHSSWREFVQAWRKKGKPALYFVKTDIANCYDSIIQGKMFSIMESILQEEIGEEEFVVRKFVTMATSQGQLKRKFQRQVSSLAEFSPDFVEFALGLINTEHLHDVVLVDKVLYQHETCTSIMATLKMHLFNNLIKVGPHYYHHTSGISQGSIISTLLCNFYYADMEKNIFTSNKEDLLLRIVDDCLFVSPSLKRAQDYLTTMLKGVKEYNCRTNMEKVVTNFPVSCCHGDQVKAITGGWFPWCGSMYNTSTLETAVDYSRYSGTKVEDTMSFDLSKTPGKTMKQKLLYFVQQKCHKLYMDPDINSLHHRLTNIFHLFMLTFYRFVVFVRKLGHKNRIGSNPQFFEGVVTAIASYTSDKVARNQTENNSQDVVSWNHVQWLCLRSALLKLGLHHSQFADLLKGLRRRLIHLDHKMSRQDLADVKRTVESGIPAVFKMIL